MKYFFGVIFSLSLLIGIGCKGKKTVTEGKVPVEKKTEVVDEHAGHNHAPGEGHEDESIEAIYKRNKRGNGIFDERLKDPCEMVGIDEVAKIFGASASDIELKDVSNRKTGMTRTCFYRLNFHNKLNAGMMISMEANAVASELPDWYAKLIHDRKTQGENTMEDDKPIRYKDFPGFGDAGAYSFKTGKYYFHLNNEILFTIAFNTDFKEQTQVGYAKDVARRLLNHIGK